MTVEHNDVLRVSCNFLLSDGSLYQNIYHYLFDGIGIITDAVIISDVKDHMELAYAELQDMLRSDILNDLSQIDIVEFVVDEWKVTRNVGTFTLTMAGVGLGDAIPNQTSCFVTLKTLRPKSVGRKFLFPIVESHQAQGVIAAAGVTDIVAYAALVIADITVAVVNALHPGIVRTGVDDYLVFTAAVVTNIIGTQRRRRPGVGA